MKGDVKYDFYLTNSPGFNPSKYGSFPVKESPESLPLIRILGDLPFWPGIHSVDIPKESTSSDCGV